MFKNTLYMADLTLILQIDYYILQIKQHSLGNFCYLCKTICSSMNHQEEISLQSLAEDKRIQVSYSDNDIVLVDSIQKFAEVNNAHISMNAIVLCTSGVVSAQMGGMKLNLHKNQFSVVPQNKVITDIMVSPDFDIKALFFSNDILHGSLLEKMNLWNDVMYVERQHVITLEDDEFLFYTSLFDTLSTAIRRQQDNSYGAEIIRALFRAAIIALCGVMKQNLSMNNDTEETSQFNVHFQRFLHLLHTSEVKYRTVEDYANQLCISPKYLTAVCKKYSGKTAGDWIREQVLEEIRYYLKQTDMSLKQVSDRIGFANPSFFGKYVKQHLGMTPIQLRQQ